MSININDIGPTIFKIPEDNLVEFFNFTDEYEAHPTRRTYYDLWRFISNIIPAAKNGNWKIEQEGASVFIVPDIYHEHGFIKDF